MKITYLGTGNAFAPQRAWASVLVNDSILFDAGPSVLFSIKRLSMDPTQIRHIFISHFHADHFFGLPFLLLEYHFSSRTETPLTIIGPPGIEEHARQLMDTAYPETTPMGWPRPINFVEAMPGARQTADGVTFSAVPMDHVPQYLHAYGYRLQLEDGVLAYSGDSRMGDSLFTLCDGARVCIVEATSQEESAVHIGRKDLRRLLDGIPEETRVLLNHLDVPGSEPWQGMNVLVPQDLQTFEFDFSDTHC